MNIESMNIKHIIILLSLRKSRSNYIYAIHKMLQKHWEQFTIGQVREALWTMKYKKLVRDDKLNKEIYSGGRKRRYLTLTIKGKRIADFYSEILSHYIEKETNGLPEGELNRSKVVV